MILRFRDLVTAPGGTIELHNDISRNHGFVWWGWWNKSGEAIPGDTFRALCTSAQQPDGLRILLLDSGRDLLFHAVCREIQWDRQHTPQASPDPSKTPPYYVEREYLAWFKLEEIHPVEEMELQKFTYVRVDQFFENGISRYAPFYGKRIHSVDELRQQDRTIWFVRPVAEDDLVHEVMLLQGKQIAPNNYQEEFAVSKSCNLLWISDPHFCNEHHSFPLSPTTARRDLGQAVEDASRDEAGVVDFAGVLISGDLTWSGLRAEFAMARNFLRRMTTSPSKLDNYRVAVVPGNHDLKFSDAPADKSAAVNEAIVPEASRKEWTTFYRDLFYLNPNEHLASGRRFLLGGCLPIEIACLNSSVIEQKKGWYQGHGFIGKDQLKHVELGMKWTLPAPQNRPFRIVMLHHHLMPVVHRETPFGGAASSVVFDAEAVTQWLIAHRVDLVLHGHMHKEFVAQVSRPIADGSNSWHTFHVLGMGSAGVAPGPNIFGVLKFDQKFTEILFVSVDPSEPPKVMATYKLPRTAG